MTFKAKYDWSVEAPKIRKRGSDGHTLQAIADSYGVSRQRMQQVVSKYIPDWSGQYGKATKRLADARNYFDKWGTRESTDLYKEQRKKFRGKKSNAVRMGIPWDIKFGELVWPTHCPVLGIELDYFNEKRAENSPSFDRYDCSKGYVSGNVYVISYRANRIKNDGTAEEHEAIAKWMSDISSAVKSDHDTIDV